MSISALLAHLQWPAVLPPPSPPPPPSPSAPLFPCRFIVLSDTLHSPGDFLFLAHLCCVLRGGDRLAVLLSSHAPLHYHHLARKWGVSLSPFESSGRLLWLDAFAPPLEEAEEGAAEAFSSPTSTAPLRLSSLLARLQRWSGGVKAQLPLPPLHVAVEDVALLEAVEGEGGGGGEGEGESDGALTGERSSSSLHSFVCRLQSLCSSSSLCVWGHRDATSPSAPSLLSLLSASSDCHLSLSPLHTGASRDVDGELSVRLTDEDSGCVTHRSLLHYKVTPSGVDVFAKGRHGD